MMSGMPLETCWAFNEWWNNKFYYKIASCWLFLLSLNTILNIFTKTESKKVTNMKKFKIRHSQISLVMTTSEKCHFKNRCHITIYFCRKLFMTPWFKSLTLRLLKSYIYIYIYIYIHIYDISSPRVKLIWFQFCRFIKNSVQKLVGILLGILPCKSTNMWHLTEKGDR
jgi:hypothetical protein